MLIVLYDTSIPLQKMIFVLLVKLAEMYTLCFYLKKKTLCVNQFILDLLLQITTENHVVRPFHGLRTGNVDNADKENRSQFRNTVSIFML